MKKILFYCQHQLGIGHLVRSLNIIQQLLVSFEVTLIQGGTDIGLSIKHKNLKHHFLTPLQMKSYTQEFYSPKGLSVEETWLKRSEEIKEIADNFFDIVITELFPLGRKAFKKEIIEMLDLVKVKNPSVFIGASLRDILVDPPEPESIEIINLYYQKLFIHSDKELCPLDSRFDELREKFHYTGFITSEKKYPNQKEKKTVLVSIGGGAVGHHFVEKCIQAARDLNEYHFTFILGVNSPKEFLEKCHQMKYENIEFIDFVTDLELRMSKAEYSINMGGYNTLMNVLLTQTKSLAFPYDENFEQEKRIDFLSEKLAIIKVDESDMLSRKLVQLFKKLDNLSTRYDTIILNGASHLAKYLQTLS